MQCLAIYSFDVNPDIGDLFLPQVEARIGAPGPEGTRLGSEIAHQFDEQTFVKVKRHLLQESVLADQIAYVVTGFATARAPQLTI